MERFSPLKFAPKERISFIGQLWNAHISIWMTLATERLGEAAALEILMATERSFGKMELRYLKQSAGWEETGSAAGLAEFVKWWIEPSFGVSDPPIRMLEHKDKKLILEVKETYRPFLETEEAKFPEHEWHCEAFLSRIEGWSEKLSPYSKIRAVAKTDEITCKVMLFVEPHVTASTLDKSTRKPLERDIEKYQRWGWRAHDGQWFLKIKDRHGFNIANEINAEAASLLAKKEIALIKESFPKAGLGNALADIAKLALQSAFHMDDGTRIEVSHISDDQANFSIYNCPIFSMAKAAGFEHLKAGKLPGCEGFRRRITTWIEILMPKNTPALERRPAHQEEGKPCVYIVARKRK